jgi:F-type H+-transporting ATPase subunit gamma
MPSLKDVKTKISGVGKTRQITKAMNMVASAKLRNAQGRIERFRPYAVKFHAIFDEVSSKAEGVAHPLLKVHEKCETALIVLITSDKGLCGSFNASVIARSIDQARKKTREGFNVKYVCIGKKARDVIIKTDYPIHSVYVDELRSFDLNLAVRIGKELMALYEQHVFDDISIVYGLFRNIAHQDPSAMQLLPITEASFAAHGVKYSAVEKHDRRDYIYEPEVNMLLNELLPRFVTVQIYRTLLDTSASEHAARMTAMDNATRNCDDMTSTLKLLYNKTRQSAITRDLIDIIGGAEALVS